MNLKENPYLLLSAFMYLPKFVINYPLLFNSLGGEESNSMFYITAIS